VTAGQAQRAASPGAAPVLEIDHLSKRFGGAKALADVALSIRPGEIHGLLGQNGSGKSTLIKILAGFHAPEPGAELRVGGQEISLPLQPGDFLKLGIAFVHQHLALVPSLTVLENLLVGENASAGNWRIRWNSEAAAARTLFTRFGMEFDPLQGVDALSSVQRAQLAIVRAWRQLQNNRNALAQILILDEPTPFLPPADVQKLFALVRNLVSVGASVIFVSHDIDEVMDITDRVTVLRDGKVAGTLATRQARKSDIIQLIVGRNVDLEGMRPPVRELGPAKVALRNVAGPNVRDFSLTMKAGEIVGLTGLIGSGYDEVVHLSYGSVRATGGTLTINGVETALDRQTPHKAIAAGVVFIPGDRQNDGAVASLTVAANATLPVLGRSNRGWLVSERATSAIATRLTDAFDVRPRDPMRLMGDLSGGNQQKVVLAKWFQIEPELILLEEPTQGVDIGAREQVFHTIRRMGEKGACVVCASSDHEQLAAICDRVIVMARGRQVASIEGAAISKAAISELCYTSAQDRNDDGTER
jgi:ribose transport system ATP-binding protein